MGIRSAFGSGVRVVLQQPLLFGVAAAVAVLSGVVQLTQFVGTIVQLLVSLLNLAIVPFLMGGLYGLAGDAFDGRAEFGTFVDEGIANYLYLLLGYVLFGVIVFIAAIPVAIVGFILLLLVGVLIGVAVLGGGVGTAGGIAIVVLGGLASLVVLLPLLAVVALLQFYDVAVVFEDEDPVEALRRSYRLARPRFANVFGYTVLRSAASLLGSIPVMYYTVSRQFAAFESVDPTANPGATPGAAPGAAPSGGMAAFGSPAEALPFIAATVVVTAVVTAVLYPTHVAYYRELRDRYADETDGTAGATGGDGATDGDGRGGISSGGGQDDPLLDDERSTDPSDSGSI